MTILLSCSPDATRAALAATLASTSGVPETAADLIASDASALAAAGQAGYLRT
jgi:uncharacterized protein (DUF2336 family)